MKAGVKKLLRAAMVPARTWRAYAVGMAPTERSKLRREMAAAAGKKSTTSLSLFMETVAWKWKKSFPQWPLSIGQKEFRQENGVTSRKKRG